MIKKGTNTLWLVVLLAMRLAVLLLVVLLLLLTDDPLLVERLLGAALDLVLLRL